MKAIVRKENPHARVFPSLFCKGSLSVAVACCAAAELYAGTGCDRRVEVACVYYPHWHEYPKGNEWFHKGFNEWEFVKDAKPRVAGQKIPLRPLYGYLDGKNPADVAKEIDLASNAGIDVFLFDWYWYGGEMTMQESLEQGFLHASNRMKMKFCLMWCYHDRVDSFRDDPRAPKRMLMKLPRTPEDFLANIRYSKKFFHEPNHWMRDGKPFFSIYNAFRFVEDMGGTEKARKILDEARKIAVADGLKGIYFQGMNPQDAKSAKMLSEAGFDCIGSYNLASCPAAWASRKAGTFTYDYSELLPWHQSRWELFSSNASVPYIPAVTAGRDVTMRCRNEEPFPWRTPRYPYDAICLGNTPDEFQKLLAAAKRQVENDPKKPGAILIYGWNEYTEGGYIAPNNFDADGALRAVAAVFGRKPSSEYTYVNPSTKQLFTIPSATYENVPYGPHAKQKIDVFLPDGRAGARPSRGNAPVVVYIHGGGWSGGAMEDHILGSSIRMLLDRGIAVVGTGYRYIRDAQADGVKPPVQGCLDDCENALKFVKSHAAEWNLDTSRIGLAGGSAGACTALYLALKDGNALGVRAVAPIIAQTSTDPQEMREWIPNSTYGAHAFGYHNFADWLAHRADCLADIERISPAALARRIDPAKAPSLFLQYGAPLKPGEIAKDATHSPVFGERFKELCEARGIPCKVNYGGKACFGDAFAWLADELCSVMGKSSFPASHAEMHADIFGQPEEVAFDGKVSSVDELRADADAESRHLGVATSAKPGFDAHGGVIDEGLKLKATGFFRVQEIDGRWWFVTPEGNRFFLIGCDACYFGESGYATPLKDPQGKPRKEFSRLSLPSRDEAPALYHGSGKLNFLAWNIARKHGTGYRSKSDDVVRRRLADWGFNSTAKWGWGWKLKGVPYFEDGNLPDGRIYFGGWPHGLRISRGRYVDMYHPAFPAAADAAAKSATDRRRNDPDLIAYALDNENGWNSTMFKWVLEAKDGEAGSFARDAFFDYVAARRGRRRDEVAGRRNGDFTEDERNGFMRLASLRYHRIVTEAYKRRDPNHLFMAEANSISSSRAWIEGQAMSPMDFIAMHEYNFEPLQWYSGSLEFMGKCRKPFAILEWSFTSATRGMSPYKSATDCTSERGRGLAYRQYAERAACHPMCLGLGYFIMYDQPFTKRSIPGENHHFGLVSQQDRPYADMVAEVRKTNARLFSLHAGTATEPFELDDFSGVLRNVPCIVRLRRKFMPGSMPGNVVCESNDNGRETLFDGNTSHLKINSGIFLSGGVNAFGTIDLSSGAVREVRATFYCYNGRKDSPGWPVFSIEADGKPAERIEATRTCEWKGRDFCRYVYSIRPPAGAERLRIGIDVRDPARSWSALLADVSTMPR